MKHVLYTILLILPGMLFAQNGGNVHTQDEALNLLSVSSDKGEYVGQRAAKKNAQYIPHIGKQIQKARENKSMTVAELSKALALNEEQLTKVEKGQSAFTRRIIGKIEVYLDCDIIIDGAG